MNKQKKIIVITVICVSFIIITVGLCSFWGAVIPKTYTTARKECKKVLDEYQIEMEQIAIDSLKLNKNISGDFKEYFYSCYCDQGYVKIEIGSQGVLGGQYWELVYTKDGSYYGETKTYLHKQTDGNNIIRAEKFGEQWWYVWTDYDGTDRSYK